MTSVIEPVRRSFAVLEALSHRRSSTVSVLVGETGLPRPTVVRLLQTLIALGYAARVSRAQGYRLTDRVLGSLSMRFPRSAMNEVEVALRFGKRLQALARAIATDVARVRPG